MVESTKSKYEAMPVLALLAVFNKSNEPILLRNYLAEYLEEKVEQHSHKVSQAKSLQSSSSSHQQTGELDVESQIDY